LFYLYSLPTYLNLYQKNYSYINYYINLFLVHNVHVYSIQIYLTQIASLSFKTNRLSPSLKSPVIRVRVIPRIVHESYENNLQNGLRHCRGDEIHQTLLFFIYFVHPFFSFLRFAQCKEKKKFFVRCRLSQFQIKLFQSPISFFHTNNGINKCVRNGVTNTK